MICGIQKPKLDKTNLAQFQYAVAQIKDQKYCSAAVVQALNMNYRDANIIAFNESFFRRCKFSSAQNLALSKESSLFSSTLNRLTENPVPIPALGGDTKDHVSFYLTRGGFYQLVWTCVGRIGVEKYNDIE